MELISLYRQLASLVTSTLANIFTISVRLTISRQVNSKGVFMTTNLRKIKTTVLVCATILIAASVYRVTAVKRSPRQQQPQIQYVTDTLPRIVHKVAKLKIVRATLENAGTPEARVILKFRNNSEVAVTAFTITNGDFSVGKDGGISVDEPVNVIEPHGTTMLDIPASNFERDVPIILAGVLYADGTEEGQDIVLEMMRDMRAREKAKRDQQKGESQP